MPVNFPSEGIRQLENQAVAGGRAKNFKDCPTCGGLNWLEETVLKSMEVKALNLLKNAKGKNAPDARTEAQMYALSADEIRRVINELIRMGDAARTHLKDISNPTEDENVY